MPVTYQNVSQQTDRSEFVSVTNEGDVNKLAFTAKVSQVPVAGGQKVPVVTDTVSLVTQKDVSCPDDACVASYVGNNVKITLTAVRGDTAAFTALLDETVRVLGLWRSTYNADVGVLPPPVATFAGA